MARFRFTLQALLDQRERVEQDRRRDVAAVEATRLELRRTLDAARAREADERRTWREILGPRDAASEPSNRASGALDLAAVCRQAHAIAGMARHTGEIERQIVRVEGELAAARERLAHAAKERRAMELLRDQRLEQWKRGEARAEEAALDEIAVAREARRIARASEFDATSIADLDSEAA
jgi:flagellar protein FliJ